MTNQMHMSVSQNGGIYIKPVKKIENAVNTRSLSSWVVRTFNVMSIVGLKVLTFSL